MRRCWWVVVPAIVCAGCNLGNPGELVGEMTVRATLQQNSCGSAVGQIPSSSDIEVKLYERAGLLTWVGSQGTFQAEIDAEGNFLFQTSGTQLLREEGPDGMGDMLPACAVDVTEEIRGKLVRRVVPETDGGDGESDATEEAADGEADVDGGGAVSAPASVEATDTLRVAPSAGASCSDFIGLGTGQFSALPCTVVLEMAGEEE
jgi:hypothetical protein